MDKSNEDHWNTKHLLPLSSPWLTEGLGFLFLIRTHVSVQWEMIEMLRKWTASRDDLWHRLIREADVSSWSIFISEFWATTAPFPYFAKHFLPAFFFFFLILRQFVGDLESGRWPQESIWQLFTRDALIGFIPSGSEKPKVFFFTLKRYWPVMFIRMSIFGGSRLFSIGEQHVEGVQSPKGCFLSAMKSPCRNFWELSGWIHNNSSGKYDYQYFS